MCLTREGEMAGAKLPDPGQKPKSLPREVNALADTSDRDKTKRLAGARQLKLKTEN